VYGPGRSGLRSRISRLAVWSEQLADVDEPGRPTVCDKRDRLRFGSRPTTVLSPAPAVSLRRETLHQPGGASVLASPNSCPLEVRARRSLAPPFMAQRPRKREEALD